MKKPRIAAIDIGSNSIRCIIAEASKGGTFKILDDEKATARLGGILRLSDGLDRRRSGLIRDVSCEFGGTTITIHLTATEDVAVEIFGGNAKKDLFEKAFGSKVAFTT